MSSIRYFLLLSFFFVAPFTAGSGDEWEVVGKGGKAKRNTKVGRRLTAAKVAAACGSSDTRDDGKSWADVVREASKPKLEQKKASPASSVRRTPTEMLHWAPIPSLLKQAGGRRRSQCLETLDADDERPDPPPSFDAWAARRMSS